MVREDYRRTPVKPEMDVDFNYVDDISLESLHHIFAFWEVQTTRCVHCIQILDASMQCTLLFPTIYEFNA